MTTNDKNAYQILDEDQNSPLHRLWKLLSFMKLLKFGLHADEALGEFGPSDMHTFQMCAGYILEEAEELGAQLEEYLTPYRLEAIQPEYETPKAARG